MTQAQKYLFDLQAFLVVEDVITSHEYETAESKLGECMKPLPNSTHIHRSTSSYYQHINQDLMMSMGLASPFTSNFQCI